MNRMRHVGHLSLEDPLYGYLRDDILPRMDVHGNPDFRVYKINASKNVYLYEDQNSRARVIGKFFGHGSHGAHGSAGQAMNQEYQNLETVPGHRLHRLPALCPPSSGLQRPYRLCLGSGIL
jgi:hypothetical protein